MRTVIRNFLSVFRRFKLAILLNVLGLSIAFAAFIVILMQVSFDRNFDRCHQRADCIYRVEYMMDGTPVAVTSRPFSDAFTKSSPHIKAGAIQSASSSEDFFSVERNHTIHYYKESFGYVTPSFVDIFHFEMEEGKARVLDDPEAALIPESLAHKFFGEEPALGKRLVVKDDKDRTLIIEGVYKDFPKNSSVSNVIYACLDKQENLHDWKNWNYCYYIRTDSPESAEDLVENFKAHFDSQSLFGEKSNWETARTDIRLTPLTQLHFTTDVLYDFTPKASRQTVFILFAIAIVILFVAGINFTNFNMALTPVRIKSINTQKVLGGSDSALRRALLAEAMGISMIAFLLSLGLVYGLSVSPVAGLVDADLNLSASPFLLGLTGILSIVLGLLAGLYPSYYVTSFPPALVLKGSFGLSPKGKQLRNSLISIQFFASFTLIISAMFMYLQNSYMQHTSLGYDKEAIIVTDLSNKVLDARESFTNQVKSLAGVKGITYGEHLLSSQDQYMTWGRRYRDQNIQFQCLPVEPNFLKVLGISVIDGRDFREEDQLTRDGAYIFNEAARKKYGIAVGESFDSSQIVGIVPDIKFASFRTEVAPMAFFVWGTDKWDNFGGSIPDYAYVKVEAGADLHAAMTHVKATLKTFDPDYPFNIRFYDEVLNNTYVKEKRITSLITLFSLLAIFISIVGVFGLVVFESQYRRKEIGIRKVLGSTTQQILAMFCKRYFIILTACFVVASPVAYWAVRRWLENFAYKTPLYAWVFVLAFLVVALITVTIVSFQCWRTANENPVNSIKTE
ncbi:ABC transporter permease [Parabacteroides sp. Marseille-P3160]|uniref:ABC transporter permease n=1 Tax=Parabacteroides sp. Marseille-P3160 TaxID=1917887 RepID=UPI0009BAED3C|nr:ABC transporter permease [Parabacteroides sp. Marseille-P3160]